VSSTAPALQNSSRGAGLVPAERSISEMDIILSFPWAEHAKLFASNFDLNKWELFQLVAPLIGYWSLCIFYDILDNSTSPVVKRYRLTDAIRANTVTKSHVVVRVIIQHVIQTALGLTVLFFDPHMCQKPEKSWPRTCFDFVLAMFVMDAWQFWIHRWMHVNKFLYNNIHSTHHKLYAPYAYGALYNHPLEAFFLDCLGGVTTMYVTGMSCKTTGYLYTFASMKVVFDHCSYVFPLNPVYSLFDNNARYHLLHHDLRGFKNNYSQPFFTIWDRIMGTYVNPNDLFGSKKAGGGKQSISGTKDKKNT
jgi:sphinganine C4-monooxygenase